MTLERVERLEVTIEVAVAASLCWRMLYADGATCEVDVINFDIAGGVGAACMPCSTSRDYALVMDGVPRSGCGVRGYEGASVCCTMTHEKVDRASSDDVDV